jgi:hypothetical protein
MVKADLYKDLPTSDGLPCSDDTPVDNEDQNFLPNYLLFLLQLIWQDRQECQARLAAIPQLRQMGLTSEQIATALNLPLDEVESYGKG